MRTNYGFHVPRFAVVVGGEQQYFGITDRIFGENLGFKEFTKKEKTQAVTKISKLYNSIADYLIDLSETGGWGIVDLTVNRGGTSGNRQWFWGKRQGEKEYNIWLVDVGPAVERFAHHDPLIFGNQFPPFLDMIYEMEKRLEMRFEEPRQKLFAYVESARLDGLAAHLRDDFLRRVKLLGIR